MAPGGVTSGSPLPEGVLIPRAWRSWGRHPETISWTSCGQQVTRNRPARHGSLGSPRHVHGTPPGVAGCVLTCSWVQSRLRVPLPLLRFLLAGPPGATGALWEGLPIVTLWLLSTQTLTSDLVLSRTCHKPQESQLPGPAPAVLPCVVIVGLRLPACLLPTARRPPAPHGEEIPVMASGAREAGLDSLGMLPLVSWIWHTHFLERK